MPDSQLPPSSVVVGIDGSRWAVDAALWAADEAVSRDIPLRLVYAIEPTTTDPHRAAHELATAEVAVRHAFTAVESTDKPVKIEVEIVQRGPARALLQASRSAAMICVGSTGLHHATRGCIGSTASAVAAAAHCPVAIVHRRIDATRARPGLIVAVLDGSAANNTVLERGVEEAELRGAPLRALTLRPATPTDERGAGEVADEISWTQVSLHRRLAQWHRRCPDVDITAELAHGNMVDYLKKNAGSLQLVVIDHGQPYRADVLLAPAGRAALEHAGCTVLVCPPESRL
jgi:nucleotide-binding universal stress UspA family protein